MWHDKPIPSVCHNPSIDVQFQRTSLRMLPDAFMLVLANDIFQKLVPQHFYMHDLHSFPRTRAAILQVPILEESRT